MANPYAELFQAPGARAFVLAGMLARIKRQVREQTGSASN